MTFDEILGQAIEMLQRRGRVSYGALKKLFLRESLNQPLVLIFEDLHWIDGETQGFLDTLSESVASAKLLLLTNYRPEYRHEWGQKTYYTQLRLAPFGNAEAEEFLDALLGIPVGAVREPPLRALKRLILDKTQGTPFFMEEIVQELREQGVLPGVGVPHALPPPTDLHIPTTVQAVLAARIDRLTPDEKALLQQLAVIGRQFPLSLVRQVVTQPEADLYRLLASLQHKEFLYEQPAFPESEYIFKHALTQEVAYGTVLQEQRKLLHERTGQTLETVYAATLHEHYSDLAHHYRHGANTEKAIHYLHLAGQQAVQRSANAEAIQQLTAALDLLQALPDTPERAQRELSVQVTLGPALIWARGYSAPEVEQTYTRALALCRHIGDTPQLFPALVGLRLFYVTSGKSREAREVGEQLLSLAQRVQDPALLLEAHRALAATLMMRGEWIPARQHAEQAMALYDSHGHRAHAFVYGQDPGVVCLSSLPWILWALGYPEQALNIASQALSLAQDRAHPVSLAYACFCVALFHQLRRDVRRSHDLADTLLTLAREHEAPFWLGLGAIPLGWVYVQEGRHEEAIAQLRQGRSVSQSVGAEIWRPLLLAVLAEAHGSMGQTAEGLTVLTEVLMLAEKTGERWCEAELYRIKGELTLQKEFQVPGAKFQESNPQPLTPNPQVEQEAEGYFLKAIAIAQKQQAKSFELRAVMSLVRLRQHQVQDHASRTTQHGSRITQHETRTRLDEAHRMLSEVYNWFTEGFDTKDLQEAKALLKEFSR